VESFPHIKLWCWVWSLERWDLAVMLLSILVSSDAVHPLQKSLADLVSNSFLARIVKTYVLSSLSFLSTFQWLTPCPLHFTVESKKLPSSRERPLSVESRRSLGICSERRDPRLSVSFLFSTSSSSNLETSKLTASRFIFLPPLPDKGITPRILRVAPGQAIVFTVRPTTYPSFFPPSFRQNTDPSLLSGFV